MVGRNIKLALFIQKSQYPNLFKLKLKFQLENKSENADTVRIFAFKIIKLTPKLLILIQTK